ncbi:ABC transporter substrate-binding protein [Candidatus Woesearchaeota archaeon]|jgi:branched-chain amino acid transport system substrate-binding protein|nr:ABC transporter substrate-binding protein [Candidatus Woesearchaeota archaeon]MBT3538270.1 ABC transporter substrate-binding protein [Candidatus Woesearchaeota archaeon]MBT4696978.1 ABC transporter substrate-binding protein [Candidatus Woesearchaeota archaeon]MBT4717436.1 ABC transporter substrate-binding protein [Candidatus Woesearchaeota archaeon]MBT7105939.1 ABC transporter substrate-binding protein [Candidatus Woesearchaeota archaeon]
MMSRKQIWVLLAVCFLLLALLLQGCRMIDGDVITGEVVSRAAVDNVKIGVITGLSGENSLYGEYAMRGLELALEKVNAEGGVDGKKVELLYEDNQFNPKLAINAARKLVEINKVDALITFGGASSTLAVMPYANEKKIVQLEAVCLIPACHTKDDYLFRVSGPGELQMRFLSEYLVDEINVSNVGLLWVNNDYGLAQKNEFVSVFPGRVVDDSFDQGETNFQSHLVKMLSADVELIVVVSYAEIGSILKHAGELEIGLQIVGTTGSQSADVLRVAGEYAEGHEFSYFSLDLDNAVAQKYAEKYRELYDESAEIYGAKGFDALLVLVEGMRGCTDTDCVMNSLYSIRNFPGASNWITIDEYGDLVDEKYDMKLVHDGEFVLLH